MAAPTKATVTVTIPNAAPVTWTLTCEPSIPAANKVLMQMARAGGFFDDSGIWHSASQVISASIVLS